MNLLIKIIIFFICLVLTTAVFYFKDNKTSQLNILAVGEEFYWTFIYPGNDGILNTDDDVVSYKRLYLPVDTEIDILLTSNDYLYMFRPESMTLREIAVPDIEFKVQMLMSEQKKIKLEIDPLCGFNLFHENDYMGWIETKSKKAFYNWYENQMSFDI